MIDDDFAGHPQPPRKFPWWGWLPAIMGCGLVLGLLLPHTSTTGRAARRMKCASNLRQIGLALGAYEGQYGCFPPPSVSDATGKPMHSWRTLILPFLDNQDLSEANMYTAYKFVEPWDWPDNSKIANVGIGIYRCRERLEATIGRTDYVVIQGPGTAFPGGGKRVSMKDVRDGPSTTILAVEWVDSGIPWAEPRDLDIGRIGSRINDPDRPGPSSNHGGMAYALMMDGSVKMLRDKLDPATFRAMLTIDGGEAIPKDD